MFSADHIQVEYVQLAASGDAAAFAKIFRTCYAGVLSLALVRLRCYADAEEAAQETFVQLWRQLPRLRQRASFMPWLRRIAIGCSARIARRPRLLNCAADHLDHNAGREPDPATTAERVESAELALRLVTGLPPAQRDAVALMAAGYSYPQIARMLGVPLGTVKRRIHDVRAALTTRALQDVARSFRRCTRPSGSTRRRLPNASQEVRSMNALLQALTRATNHALFELYRTCDRIELADNQINGRRHDPWVYAALLERIKYNANLQGGRFRSGARSRVLLQFGKRRRNFDVHVGPAKRLLLTLTR